MKILLIGKTGQLGSDLIRNNTTHEIIAPDRSELDITDPATAERALNALKPDVLINTAAFHNVPMCEQEPDKAFLINCVAVRDLARLCSKSNITFVTFSSDYVFGGDQRTPYSESDPPRPVQIYGITRAAGEYAALSEAPDHAIVIRTCGLYGLSGATSKGGNFVDKRIAEAKQHPILEMGSDQTVCPTYTGDLSNAVVRLLEHPSRTPGIYHLVNEGECTWYEFTEAVYEFLAIKVDLRSVDRQGRNGDMRRPLYSALANTKARALGIILPQWRDALERYLKEKYGIQYC
jgi:dTDP-4-dehydrorhamnose reductase